MNPKKKKNAGVVNDEVEELLRAAEDAALLKLSLNSHTVRPSPSDLDPNLDQRFRNLKLGSKSKSKPETSTKRMSTPEAGNGKEEEGEDDLFKRFSALKASLPKPSTSMFSSSSGVVGTSDTSLEHINKLDGGCSVGEGNIDNDEEDEVEKVIRWAMDAARLDPSLPSDDEENTKDDENYDDNEESDEEDDSPKKQRNQKSGRK